MKVGSQFLMYIGDCQQVVVDKKSFVNDSSGHPGTVHDG